MYLVRKRTLVGLYINGDNSRPIKNKATLKLETQHRTNIMLAERCIPQLGDKIS